MSNGAIGASGREKVDAWNEQNPDMQRMFRRIMRGTATKAEHIFVNDWCMSHWEDRPMRYRNIEDVLEEESRRVTDEIAKRQPDRTKVCPVRDCDKDAQHRGAHGKREGKG